MLNCVFLKYAGVNPVLPKLFHNPLGLLGKVTCTYKPVNFSSASFYKTNDWTSADKYRLCGTMNSSF